MQSIKMVPIFIISFILLSVNIIDAESYTDLIVKKDKLSKSSGLKGIASNFAKSEEYYTFVKHEGIIGRDIIFKEEKVYVDNIQKSYYYPGKIPANTDSISDEDKVNVYTLFNVIYFIEKKGIGEEEGAFASYSSPTPQQTIQGVITSFVYNKTLANKGEFSLYVLGSNQMKKYLGNYEGQKVGNAVLKSINSGHELPQSPPSVLFVGKNVDNIEKIVTYCRENKIMSITNNPKYFSKGISVNIGMMLNQTRMILNTNASQSEGLEWTSKNLFYRQIDPSSNE